MAPTLSDVHWRRGAHVLGAVLLVGAVALVAIVAVPTLVGAEESYVVTSGSMEPAIGAGSVVFVSDVPQSAIRTGDVVTYHDSSTGALVTHRVVDVDSDGTAQRFRTKGDANEEPDPEPVAGDDIVGIVQFNIPLVGYLITWAQRPVGIVALVILPAVLLVILELRDLYQAAAKDTEPEEDA